MDSSFTLLLLKDLGIEPKIHSFSFSKDQTDYGSLQVKAQCKKFGIKEPEFFYMDKYDLFRHIDFLTFEKRIAYPTLHCYYMDYYLSLTGDTRFFCGMFCDFRVSNGIITLNVAPPALANFNPNRLHQFQSSKTFLAFINDPIFKDNYLKPNPMIDFYGENIWHIRDLIYSNFYPELGIITKTNHEDAYLTIDFYENKLPIIKKMFPMIFCMKPFLFDAKIYLN